MKKFDSFQRGSVALLLSFSIGCLCSYAGQVKQYDVIWDSPSTGMGGSMPIGNGDIGANLWFDQNDLVFYISKMDSWDDNGRLAKVGKVRVALSPNPFVGYTKFRQELDLENGQILIHADGQNPTSLKFWIDANHPVIQIQTKSEKPVTARASIELWRNKQYSRPVQVGSPFRDDPQKRMHVVEPDVVLKSLSDHSIGWYHRNIKSIGPKMTMEFQGLDDYPDFKDPWLHRTFGAIICGTHAKRLNDKQLEKQGKENNFSIYVQTEQPATAEKWLASVRESARTIEAIPLAKRYQAHCAWWNAFWERSWISIQRGKAKAEELLPENEYEFRIGADRNHENQLAGTFGRFTFFNRALSAKEMATMAAVGPEVKKIEAPNVLYSAEGKADFDLPGSSAWGRGQKMSIETWIKPQVMGHEGGRIVDKLMIGTSDGFLLDTYPGNSLRLLVKKGTIGLPYCLPAGKWAHVGVVLDSEQKRLELYLNGKCVKTLPEQEDDAFVVSRAYQLQRFINAAAGRGKFPIKFNGSIFNVDFCGDPDDRLWGQGYWWQNSRLPYTTMTLAGDFDLMRPLFKMYTEKIYPLCKYRVKKYFGFDGAYFAECMYPWGAIFSETYGWAKPMRERKDPIQASGWHKWEWVCGPELVFMMMDYSTFSGDTSLIKSKIIPISESIFSFFEHYYKVDSSGKLLMYPSQALETWWNCTNPMPEIAGLRAIATRLLQLDESYSTAAQRKHWRAFLDKLPELPTRETPDGLALAPAKKFEHKPNLENPELYAVFPFRQIGVGNDHLELGLNALKHRWDRGVFGWRQDNVFMAYLGLADEARDYLVQRVKNYGGGFRFPVFWTNSWNATPCQDHGSIAMRSLQAMLMQHDPYSEKVYLLPAWPKEWDVQFKLHASRQTTVEGRVKDGKLVELNVVPASRMKDVVLCGEFGSDVKGLPVLSNK